MKKKVILFEIVSLGIVLFAMVAIGGCCKQFITVTTHDGTKVLIPRNCDPLVEYQANHIAIAGIAVPIPESGSVTIGNVEWKKDKLQEAGEAAKLLDMKRISLCNTCLGATTVNYPEC